jgi:Tfp pilus assembly protein PilZ
MPAKISAIEDNGQTIALVPMGRPTKVQRRVFPRVIAEDGVKLKLEFDNGNSLYRSLQVYDISGGGIGLTIYSKKAIFIGQRAKLEIEFHMHKNRVQARGEVVHCAQRSESSREFLIGIMFVQISEVDQAVVLEFVAAEMQRQMMAGKIAEQKSICAAGMSSDDHVEQVESPAQDVDAEETAPCAQDDRTEDEKEQPDELPLAV